MHDGPKWRPKAVATTVYSQHTKAASIRHGFFIKFFNFLFYNYPKKLVWLSSSRWGSLLHLQGWQLMTLQTHISFQNMVVSSLLGSHLRISYMRKLIIGYHFILFLLFLLLFFMNFFLILEVKIWQNKSLKKEKCYWSVASPTLFGGGGRLLLNFDTENWTWKISSYFSFIWCS